MKIEKHRITLVKLACVDHSDAPNYCDAYVEDCHVDGRKATEAELEAISSDADLTFSLVQENVW